MRKIDTEVIVSLPEKSKVFTSKFREDKINEIGSRQHRLWIEIINKSFTESIKIGRNKPIEFLVIESQQLRFYRVPSKKRRQQLVKRTRRNILRKQKKNWKIFE